MAMLKGKRVVVLGGSAGIGLAVAQLAAADGARVVIGSSRQARVDEACARVPGAEGQAVDLRSEDAIRAFFGKVGVFDHLVYTAGEELLMAPLAELDLTAARAFLEVRFWGALTAVKAAQAQLAKDGSIVLTSGTAARRPPPGFSLAASICGAMESLTRALALELAPVRVNLVIPGLVDSDLWANVPKAALEQMFAEAAAKMPVKRVGKPEDIAEHYLSFLRGGYVTGQSLVVDGGGVLV